MVSLMVLIAAGLLTSSSAVVYLPQSTADARAGAGAKLRRKFKNHFLVHVSAGILALGSILVAVHVQQGAFQ
ncbi:hypothetical protein [Arthrobacter sp. HS15c]|uniref:hypothetical protein n=1 Tax=Arthrobacter sp. HS15c TaxID=3230279 RepID=UPI003465B163